MARAWRIYRTFVRSSFVRAMQFKADFFGQLLSVASWITFIGFAVVVVYENVETVAGWERGPGFVIAGTSFLVSALCYLLFPSLIELPEQFRRGTLDFVLTKPVDSQFWVSCRKVQISDIGTVLGSGAMVAYGAATTDPSPSPHGWTAYAVALLAGVALLYSFRLALMTLGVWFVRVDNLWALEEAASQVARQPVDVFGMPIRVLLTHILPIALFATVPTRLLVGRGTAYDLGNAVLWGIAGLILSRKFWLYAMRSYSSASS